MNIDIKKDTIARRKAVRDYLAQLAGSKGVPDDPELIDSVLNSVVHALGGDYKANGELPTPDYPADADDANGETDFEEYLCSRSDKLTNTTYAFLCQMAGKKLEWDIGLIRDILDGAIGALGYDNVPVCNPFREDDIPCYLCEYAGGCPVPVWECPMKQKEETAFPINDTLIAADANDGFCLVINVKHAEKLDLVAAFHAAAQEFGETDAGKTTVNEIGSFNYGDFVDEVPRNICMKHGFYITGTKTVDTIVPHNEILIDLG